MEWVDHVREIRADPESDGPRLVCADWLLDRADVRGEYIVTACQLAGLQPGTPEYAAIDQRRRQLYAQHHRHWLKRITTLGAHGSRVGDPPSFTRGFVEAITLIGQNATSFAAICDREPITDVTFVNCGPSNYERVAAMPALDLVRVLNLRGDEVLGCEALLASPHLSSVIRLTLPIHAPHDPTMLAALAAGTARPEEFWLGADVPSLYRLGAGGFFARMMRLQISGLTDDGAVALADAAMPALRRLALEDPQLTERGMTALRSHLAHLEHLRYTGIAPAPAAVPVLVEALSAGALRSLDLDGWVCDPLADLVESPAFASVELLFLAELTPRIADALRATRYRHRLRSLSIGDAGEEASAFELDGVVIDRL